MIIKLTVPGLADSLVIPLENKVNELNTEIVDLNKEYQELINDLNQSYQELINNINTAHRVEVNDLNNTISVKDAEISNLTESVNVKNILINELTEDVEELTNTNELLNTNIAITNLLLREIAGEDTPIPVLIISNSKEDIKESLIKKGANPTDVLSSYSSLIDNLSTGNADVIIRYIGDYATNDNPVIFPESCISPIYIANGYTQTEWNFPNAKLLLFFPAGNKVAQYTSNTITFNLPNCEEISKVLLFPRMKFITSDKLKSLNYGFNGMDSTYTCYSLEITDTSNVRDISHLFYEAALYTDLTLSLPKLEKTEYAFYFSNQAKKTLNITINDVSNPFDASRMTMTAVSNQATNLYSNNILRVTNATLMFLYNICTHFPTVSFEKGCDAASMFYYCSNFNDFSKLLNTQNLTNTQSMFGYTNITEVPESFNYENVTDLRYMYVNCKKLFYLPKINNTTNKWNDIFGYSSIIKVEEIQSGELYMPRLDYMTNSNCISNTYNVPSLRYVVVKGLGLVEDPDYTGYSAYIKFTGWSNWGVEDASIPLSTGARQSLVDSLITYSNDRVSKGLEMGYNISLSSTTKALLTDEEIALITAKGYTIA